MHCFLDLFYSRIWLSSISANFAHLFCPGPFVTEFAAPAVVACAGAGPLRLLNHSVDALTLVQIVRLDQLTCAFLWCFKSVDIEHYKPIDLPRLLCSFIRLLKQPRIGMELSERREQQWSSELTTATLVMLHFFGYACRKAAMQARLAGSGMNLPVVRDSTSISMSMAECLIRR